MRISIAQRWRPFSHALGGRCLIPGTALACDVYPTLIAIWDLSGLTPRHLEDVPLDLVGPVSQFTVRQDLEVGQVDVWGHSQKGYFHYILKGQPEGGLRLLIKRFPADAAMPTSEICCHNHPSSAMPVNFENLSFGVAKAQEWPGIRGRGNLEEILPLWFRLGQWALLPQLQGHASLQHIGGAAHLLYELERRIAEADLIGMAEIFRCLLCVGFEGMFSPRLIDSEHQGVPLSPLDMQSRGSPLLLLSHGHKLIRNMLLAADGVAIDVLPALLPDLHCGRLLNVHLAQRGTIDMEWSKKHIRRMVFNPTVDGTHRFIFHKGISSCRLRMGDKGAKLHYSSGETFDFFAGTSYFFDNFK
jgi:hypothetical protein